MSGTLGSRVAEMRQLRGYTQKELAETIKRLFPYFKGGQSTIQAIESGQSKKPTILYELARALNCSEQFLMTGQRSVADQTSMQQGRSSIDQLEAEVQGLVGQPQRPPPRPLPGRPALPPPGPGQPPIRPAPPMPAPPQRPAAPPPFLNNRRQPQQEPQVEIEPEDDASSDIHKGNISRFGSAVLGSFQMLGLSEDEAAKLIEIITEVATEPLIAGSDAVSDLESRRILAAHLTKRFLREKDAK